MFLFNCTEQHLRSMSVYGARFLQCIDKALVGIRFSSMNNEQAYLIKAIQTLKNAIVEYCK